MRKRYVFIGLNRIGRPSKHPIIILVYLKYIITLLFHYYFIDVLFSMNFDILAWKLIYSQIQYDFINRIFRITILMEDQKKKFLLSRIRREEELIKSEYNKFKIHYQGKRITPDRHESYLKVITTLIEINNSLPANLYQYLDRTQMDTIFTRNAALFADLMDNFKKCHKSLIFIESGQDCREIREICDVCHQKLESSRITNIKRSLEQSSESREALLKRLIDESEKQSLSPVFTQDEDRQFKKELQKVFKNKEQTLQTNITESSAFLATCESEITEFMIGFRNEFAAWEFNKEVQNENWGKIMKLIINKKLANSFHSKLPSWIKKMHDLFVDHLPVKPKIYVMSKAVQATDTPTDSEIKLTAELAQLQNNLIVKREALKSAEELLEKERLMTNHLRLELENVQKFYVDMMAQTKRSEKKKQTIIGQTLSKELVKNQLITQQVKLDELDNLDILDNRRLKQKIAKIGIIQGIPNKSNLKKRMEIGEKTKEEKSRNRIEQNQNVDKMSQLLRKAKSTQNYIQSSESKDYDMTMERGSMPLTLTNITSSNAIDSTSNLKNDKAEQTKAQVNREIDNRKIFISEISASGVQKQKKQKQFNKQLQQKLREEASEIMEKDINQTALIKNVKNKYRKSIATEGNASVPGETLQNTLLKPTNFLTNRLQSVQQTQLKTIPATSRKDGQGKTLEVIQQLISLHKCNQIMTDREKSRLVNVIEHFFENITERGSTTVNSQLFKLPKMIVRKQNIKSPFKAKKVKGKGKQQQQDHCGDNLYRKNNKSLQNKSVKFPLISIRNTITTELESEPLQVVDYDCLKLFVDDKTALKYQESFLQTQSKETIKPTPTQIQEIQTVYSILQGLKGKNSTAYSQMCSFIRYPYSSLRTRHIAVDIINNLSFSSFCNLFFRIMWVHRQCQQEHTFCPHICGFIKRLNTMLDTNQCNGRLEMVKSHC